MASLNHSPRPLPSDEQFDRLTGQIADLSEQVAQLQQRVAALEQAPSLLARHNIAVTPPSLPREEQHKPSSTITGLKLLNRAGALTLFVGIIFFFKYAVDNQWIDATGRVVLGIIAGVALLAAGEWVRKHGQTVFAQGLSACGIATLYISIYAASNYYHLVSAVLTFVTFLLISGLAVFLSIRSSDTVLAVVGYLGAIAAPGLFRLISLNAWVWFTFIYLVLVQIAVLIQARIQSRRVLAPVAAAAMVLQAFWTINPSHAILSVLFFPVLAALHFRPLKLGFIRTGLDASAYVIGHILVLLAGLRLLFFWFEKGSSVNTMSNLLGEAISIFLGIYGVALLAFAVLRKSTADRLLGLTLLGVVIGKLYVFDVWLLTRFYRITAF